MKKINQYLLFAIAFIPITCANAEDKITSEWLIQYSGKSTNVMRQDDKFEPLVHRDVPDEIYNNLLEGLSGPPDPVYVVNNRYVSMSACVAHWCPMKGFFWTDIQSNVGIGAVWGDTYKDRDRLTIGSNEFSHGSIPPEAKLALVNWLSENDLRPRKVDFIEKEGKRIQLKSTDFQPLEVFTPPAGGPSFDCLKASGAIEKAICGNEALKTSDLSLARLFSQIRKGHADLSSREKLVGFQRAWIKDRNAKCALEENIVLCLETSYKEQHDRLMNWRP
jgi:uncharacterized protein YecT (DUF1311 family)